MAYMILEFTFKDNAFAEIAGTTIKFWANDGLPTYEGGLEGFETLYPLYMTELVRNKAVKLRACYST